MRLIDADALILALETQDYSGSPESLEDWTPQDITKAEINDINNAPTIDAEPVRHGHWIGKPIAGYGTVRCSECGNVFLENNGKWEYCPNCGCKMDEQE